MWVVPAGQQRAHHAFQAFLLVQQVAGQAQALATEVQAQGEHGKLAALMVDGGIAVAVDAVEAHAEGVVLAEAPADVEVSAELAALGQSTLTRVSGWSSARLGTRLMVPPTLPPGEIPPSRAFGPLSTSTRSANSIGTRQNGSRP